MSASLIISRCVQVTVYDQGDSYSHIRAGTVDQPGIICDTVSDLPAQAGGIAGMYLEMESSAHVISTNEIYTIDSSGSWIRQEQSPFKDVYTKSQVDALLASMQYEIDSFYVYRYAETALIDNGAKNLLNVFTVRTPQVINGITWTINSDGTVSASGTASANSFLYLLPNNSNIAYGVETVISGCPAGGSASTYEIQVAMVGGTTYHDYGSGETIPDDYVYRYFVCAVRSGQSIPAGSPLVFKPMICRKTFADITSAFVPYSPTNAELYQLIRSYHP